MSQHTQQDVIETLKSAKSLIETKGHTKGAFARNSAGEGTHYADADLTRFCAVGAMKRAASERFDNAYGEDFHEYTDLSQAAADYFENSYDGDLDIPHWNDAPTRTREEVLHTFSLAIQMAESDLLEHAHKVVPGAAVNSAVVKEVA